MYKQFYNLKQNPFSLTPDPQFLCMTGQHREALSGLIYSICTRPGLTLLVGEVGTGKTTLLYTLLSFLEKRRYVIAMLTNPRLSRDEFYDFLLTKLEVPCTSSLRSQQLIALQETLLKNRAAGRPSVLIVDECQRLHPDLMEEIRLLMNLETPREKLLQVILAGQPELSEILRRGELRQLKQRINHFCTLQPLSLQELSEYLQHRLARAGLPNQDLFPGAIIEAIHQYTNGIPRLVNTLCDNALRIGFALQSSPITLPIIREAASELELLPSVPQGALSQTNLVRLPLVAAPAPSMTLAAASSVTSADFGSKLKPEQPIRIPLESYAVRQKSLGFLGGILDRWR